MGEDGSKIIIVTVILVFITLIAGIGIYYWNTVLIGAGEEDVAGIDVAPDLRIKIRGVRLDSTGEGLYVKVENVGKMKVDKLKFITTTSEEMYEGEAPLDNSPLDLSYLEIEEVLVYYEKPDETLYDLTFWSKVEAIPIINIGNGSFLERPEDGDTWFV